MLYLAAALSACFLGYLYLKPSRVIYLKRLMLPAACIIFTLCLIFFSKTAVTAARRGLNLWLDVVVPSLLPFFIAAELLKASGFIRSAGILFEPIMRPLFKIPGAGSFAFLMGISSGYPVGAIITTDLYDSELLTRNEAERLLAFSNNSGPLFIIGAVAVGMFKTPSLGLFLLFSHLAAGFTVGFLYRFSRKKNGPERTAMSREKSVFRRFKKELRASGKVNPGMVLGAAVTNSLQTILMIGGFIVFFSVLINLLLETGFISLVSDLVSPVLVPFGIEKGLIEAVLCGVFEITTGTSMVSKLASTPLQLQLAAVSLIIGWAGLSVHSQVLGIISKKGLGIKRYILGKLLQGFFAAFYTLVLFKAAEPFISGPKAVFNDMNTRPPGTGWQGQLLASSLLLGVVVCTYLLLYIKSLRRH